MIHVVFGVDGYVAQMAVSMVSMYESNRNNQIQTYVVCLNLNEDEKNKLIELASKYHRTIEFLYIDQDKLKNLKIFFHLSHATFYRLFIPAMLPQLKKIIYLDCDILVEADLSELWNIDMNGYGNGGVIFNGDDTEKRLKHCERSIFELREFVDIKSRETDFEHVKMQCMKLTENINAVVIKAANNQPRAQAKY